MKRTLSITALVLTIAFSPFFKSVMAQPNFRVSYDTLNFPQPQQLDFGDTVHYDFLVWNTGNQIFTGNIHIVLKVDTFPLDTLMIFHDTLIQNESVQVNATDVVSAARYGGGINVVVIWPTAPNVTTEDTITADLDVRPLAVDDPFGLVAHVEVFPNPARDRIFLRNPDATARISQTRIFDTQGKLLREADGLPSEMPVDDLATGVYFLHVDFKDGRKARFKLIRH